MKSNIYCNNRGAVQKHQMVFSKTDILEQTDVISKADGIQQSRRYLAKQTVADDSKPVIKEGVISAKCTRASIMQYLCCTSMHVMAHLATLNSLVYVQARTHTEYVTVASLLPSIEYTKGWFTCLIRNRNIQNTLKAGSLVCYVIEIYRIH